MKPSVSDLLDLLNKPALLHWANRIGLEGVSLAAYRKVSTGKGISLHDQVRRYFLHNEPMQDVKLMARADCFRKLYKLEAMEQDIDFHFTGRYDMKVSRDGVLYVFDLKSSNTVYMEQLLQLVAYQIAMPEVNQVGIINLNTFQERVIVLSEVQHKAAVSIIRSLYSIWENKKTVLGALN